jgi:tetratricopeptide (TPR) repeat protein
MKYTIYLYALILIVCLGSCRTLFGTKAKTKRPENETKAEDYYLKSLTILNNATHNALSIDLSLESLEYSKKAIELNPKVSEYYRVRGASYYHLKNYDSALINYNDAIKIDSTNSSAWMGVGIVLENTEKYDLAEFNYLKALDYDKNSTVIYFNLGLLYEKSDKPSFAMKSYDKVIELDSNYASAYINRGDLKLKNRLYIEAISDFNIAISLDSLDKISYNNRGLCNFYLKEYQSAIYDFERALNLNLGKSFDENFDTDKYSYNNIANSYFGLNNITKACEFWNIAIKKGYKYRKEWKEIYQIEDPNELIKKYCN